MAELPGKPELTVPGAAGASVIKLDCLHLRCPDPLMLLRQALRQAAAGQMFEILSDDPVSLRDIPALCHFMHHELLATPDEAHPHTFRVKKGTGCPQETVAGDAGPDASSRS